MTEYTQGISGGGAALLADGQPLTIEEILEALRERDKLKSEIERLLEAGEALSDELEQWSLTESDPETRKAQSLWAAAKRKTPTQSPAAVPEGYALVPRQMSFDLEAMQRLLAITGDDFTEDEFPGCDLWVGETKNPGTGGVYYGLNVCLEEYPEEGSLPIIEFKKPSLSAAPETPVPAVPNEQGKNRYGLDMAYFRNLINREMNRPLVDFRPDELARVFARASRTADATVLQEPEFNSAPVVPERYVLIPQLPDDELAALHRFRETTLDDQSYDLPKSMMHRLSSRGALRHLSAGRYEITITGLTMLDAAPESDQ